MIHDYDRRYEVTSRAAVPAYREKLAGATLKAREYIDGSSVRVNTYEFYGGPRKTYAVRRYHVVEWGMGRRDQRSTPFKLKRDAVAFAQEKAESLRVVYAVGDTIDAFGRAMGTGKGTSMRALVQDRKVDIKNGKPGWVGILISSRDQKEPADTAVWGFDEDIKQRVGR